MEAYKKRQTFISFKRNLVSGTPAEKKLKTYDRKLQLQTAYKWKVSTLAKYNDNDWLEIESVDGIVTAIKCKVCREYASQIQILKGYTPKWSCGKGCSRLQHSSAITHAEGMSHQKAFEIFMKTRGMNLCDRIEKLNELQQEMRQTDILSGIQTMNSKDLDLTKKKFEVAYFIAKEELSLCLYPKIIQLEEKHGVVFGQAYKNENTCGEKEVIFAVIFNPAPTGKSEVNVECDFLSLLDVEYGTSHGVFNTIKKSLENIEVVNCNKKLVGFGADGASVNRGSKSGVKMLLKAEVPWITFGWCVAHRLELSLKEKLGKTASFNDVDYMILKMHYIYKKSPKKLRQLGELVSILEDDEYNIGGYRPKKASGTRWISHKVQALEMILDKYGVYLTHLENMTEDITFTNAERAKFKGYHKKWIHARMPLYIALFIEILAPAKMLSKCFQSDEIDVLASSGFVQQAKSHLNRIQKTKFINLPTVKRFLAKVTEKEGKFYFQGVALNDFVNAKHLVKKSKSIHIELVTNSIIERLETSDTITDMYGTKVLNTEGWLQSIENETFLDEGIENLFDFYRAPLRHAGFAGTVNDVLDAWHSLVNYTVKYLAPHNTGYRKLWHQIFSSSMKNEWVPVLLIVELSFTLPVSNAKVERLFSLMNRLKTDTRNSLKEKRLENLIRVSFDEKDSNLFDLSSAIELWTNDAKAKTISKKMLF
ncbi:E3 SUMO-protein ligase KIAA1586-like [Hydra vulgaris]|uniref:E3 SUMO-protein ligase KIAA1586-like n=1 Tax=Hydra vulgaris TaxID=6087 RepID=UPI001F5FC4D0|nr:E3 SUMO-protein ligase KIAA1586-like [Hydra vulgaris]